MVLYDLEEPDAYSCGMLSFIFWCPTFHARIRLGFDDFWPFYWLAERWRMVDKTFLRGLFSNAACHPALLSFINILVPQSLTYILPYYSVLETSTYQNGQPRDARSLWPTVIPSFLFLSCFLFTFFFYFCTWFKIIHLLLFIIKKLFIVLSSKGTVRSLISLYINKNINMTECIGQAVFELFILWYFIKDAAVCFTLIITIDFFYETCNCTLCLTQWRGI